MADIHYIFQASSAHIIRTGGWYNNISSVSNTCAVHLIMIAFISDLHLTPDRPDSTLWFEKFMGNAIGKIDEIFILGDLFEVWIGDDAHAEIGQTRVEEILKSTSDSGIKLYFMHGNRDFLVGEDFEKRTGCKILPDPSLITLGGESVLLAHGDTLCIDDIEHQKMRAQMVTSKWKLAFLNKPIEERIDTALTMRGKSEQGKQIKNMEIMDVNQAHIEKVMQQHGVLKLIHGHTHKPAVHEFVLNGLQAKRYVLGDWYTQKSILYYENGNFSLQV